MLAPFGSIWEPFWCPEGAPEPNVGLKRALLSLLNFEARGGSKQLPGVSPGILFGYMFGMFCYMFGDLVRG